jgi:2-oxoglutarate ferredoxin oxidoreductase subunit delta
MDSGVVKINVEKCKGCGLCIHACPFSVLSIHTAAINTKGYHPVNASDPKRCIGCGFCAIMCPDGAISVYKNDKEEVR